MKPTSALLLLGTMVVLPVPVWADIYMVKAADGTLMLTNVYRKDPAYVRLRRELRPLEPVREHRVLEGNLPYAAQVADAAARNDLPEALLHAVIQAESNYDRWALSPKGAAGLMQLMPDTAREMGVENVWDPAANIHGGARYLKKLLTFFDNDLNLAVAAYNAGPGAVVSQGSVIPPFAETQRYVPRVLERYRHLQAAGGTAP